jgi:hypothetical protein
MSMRRLRVVLLVEAQHVGGALGRFLSSGELGAQLGGHLAGLLLTLPGIFELLQQLRHLSFLSGQLLNDRLLLLLERSLRLFPGPGLGRSKLRKF